MVVYFVFKSLLFHFVPKFGRLVVIKAIRICSKWEGCLSGSLARFSNGIQTIDKTICFIIPCLNRRIKRALLKLLSLSEMYKICFGTFGRAFTQSSEYFYQRVVSLPNL